MSPAATEIICALGAESALAAVTTEDEYFHGIIGVPVAGPPGVPDETKLKKYRPDLIILDPALATQAALTTLTNWAPVLVLGSGGPLTAAESRVETLGVLLGRKKEAAAVLNESRELLATVALKTAKVEKRLAVIRLHGQNGRLYVAGAGSWSNLLVELAGGSAPIGLPSGQMVELSPALLSDLNPDLMFACGRDHKSIDRVLSSGSFKKIPAVKNSRLRYFPCALTDRAAAHVGYFAAWLASTMYPVDFGKPENLVHPQGILQERELKLDQLPFVTRARVVYARQSDFVQKSLLIDLAAPLSVISTSDGPLDGVKVIGNCSSPPMVWDIQHQGGWEADLEARYKLLGLDQKSSALMFTGADMDNLAVKTVTESSMTVTALVTAGAESNAVRTSRDVGAYVQPGTINIIVLTSRSLSEAGAARALITITEAKTAALWDLGIRSSQTPLTNPATGTGTDSIIVVSGGGRGQPIDYTGGHAKIGELIASAVHGAVTEALAKGNGKAPGRNLLIRLRERGLYHDELFTGPAADLLTKIPGWADQVALVLLDSPAAGFTQNALALDDALIMQQADDLTTFRSQSLEVASQIAQTKVTALFDLAAPSLPPALKLALDSVGTGLALKKPN
jgi:adenosylcobinamide amidohydrolase/ABC-type Fe3+-hydroxamate transport system substrate-binding protein